MYIMNLNKYNKKLFHKYLKFHGWPTNPRALVGLGWIGEKIGLPTIGGLTHPHSVKQWASIAPTLLARSDSYSSWCLSNRGRESEGERINEGDVLLLWLSLGKMIILGFKHQY